MIKSCSTIAVCRRSDRRSYSRMSTPAISGEHCLVKSLRRLQHARTTVVIAHRLTTVGKADRVIVLDGGRAAAQGRHDELVRTIICTRGC